MESFDKVFSYTITCDHGSTVKGVDYTPEEGGCNATLTGLQTAHYGQFAGKFIKDPGINQDAFPSDREITIFIRQAL
jgi:hypothetical protein